MGWFKSFPLTNIYHCTVHKAGSQWVSGIFSDEIILRKTGMKTFTYQKLLPGGFDPRKITDRFFYLPFPERKIVTPLYISYECYCSIVKPASYKSLYLYRDPRDILVSYYHSVKKSHPLMGDLEFVRSRLCELNQEDGLIYCINRLKGQGFWDGMRSWRHADDSRLIKVRYESLIVEDPFAEFQKIMDHLEITLSRTRLERLIGRHKFEKLSAGRKMGEESDMKHVRKGVAGDWQNYFTPAITRAFDNDSEKIQTYLNYD